MWWQHPVLGLLLPAEFIHVAEEIGLVVPLGRWVLREACRQAQAWHDGFRAAASLVVDVNFSAWQLQQTRLVEEVASALGQAGLDPACLELEITGS